MGFHGGLWVMEKFNTGFILGDFKGYVGPMLGPMLWPCWVIWWLLWGSLEVSGKEKEFSQKVDFL